MKNENKEQLLECPFCGGEGYLKPYMGQTRMFYEVGCSNKKCLHNNVRSAHAEESEAITAWNTRAQSAEVDNLKALLKDVRKGIDWQLNGVNQMTIHEIRQVASRIDDVLK